MKTRGQVPSHFSTCFSLFINSLSTLPLLDFECSLCCPSVRVAIEVRGGIFKCDAGVWWGMLGNLHGGGVVAELLLSGRDPIRRVRLALVNRRFCRCPWRVRACVRPFIKVGRGNAIQSARPSGERQGIYPCALDSQRLSLSSWVRVTD